MTPIAGTLSKSSAWSAFVVLVSCGPILAQAQPAPPPDDSSKKPVIIAAMQACTREVRSASGTSNFDAYFNTRGQFRLYGSEQETLLFKECMRQKGHSTDTR